MQKPANLIIVLVIGFVSQSPAQITQTDIGEIKVNLLNYADSGCRDEAHVKRAMKHVSELSNRGTELERVALREALSGVREALIASMKDEKSICISTMRSGVQKLDALPTSEKIRRPLPNRKPRRAKTRFKNRAGL